MLAAWWAQHSAHASFHHTRAAASCIAAGEAKGRVAASVAAKLRGRNAKRGGSARRGRSGRTAGAHAVLPQQRMNSSCAAAAGSAFSADTAAAMTTRARRMRSKRMWWPGRRTDAAQRATASRRVRVAFAFVCVYSAAGAQCLGPLGGGLAPAATAPFAAASSAPAASLAASPAAATAVASATAPLPVPASAEVPASATPATPAARTRVRALHLLFCNLLKHLRRQPRQNNAISTRVKATRAAFLATHRLRHAQVLNGDAAHVAHRHAPEAVAVLRSGRAQGRVSGAQRWRGFRALRCVAKRALEVQMTSRRCRFIQVSQLTRMPL